MSLSTCDEQKAWAGRTLKEVCTSHDLATPVLQRWPDNQDMDLLEGHTCTHVGYLREREFLNVALLLLTRSNLLPELAFLILSHLHKLAQE